jgi:hypothetical protein
MSPGRLPSALWWVESTAEGAMLIDDLGYQVKLEEEEEWARSSKDNGNICTISTSTATPPSSIQKV